MSKKRPKWGKRADREFSFLINPGADDAFRRCVTIIRELLNLFPEDVQERLDKGIVFNIVKITAAANFTLLEPLKKYAGIITIKQESIINKSLGDFCGVLAHEIAHFIFSHGEASSLEDEKAKEDAADDQAKAWLKEILLTKNNKLVTQMLRD